MENTKTRTTSRIFVARLIGASVFNLLGGGVDKVHDVIALLQIRGKPRTVDFVIEVSNRRRVSLPLSGIATVESGVVITTDLVSIRRFTQRHMKILVIGKLLGRMVTMRDGSRNVTVRDVAIERDRGMDWKVIRPFVQRAPSGPLGLHRGGTFTMRPDEVSDLVVSTDQQGTTALLATLKDLKPADLADVMRDLPQDGQMRMAAELTDKCLANVLGELGNKGAVALLPRLEAGCAAHVLGAVQPDDTADLVTDLPQLKAAELLGLMGPEEAEDVRRLMAYNEHTAGGLVITGPIILPPESTVATFLTQSRKAEIPSALVVVGFACHPPLKSPIGKLVGMIHLQRALRECPQRMVGSIMGTDINSVRPKDSIGAVIRLLVTYNLVALPASDDVERLLDAVGVDDVLDHLISDDWHVVDEAVTNETIKRGVDTWPARPALARQSPTAAAQDASGPRLVLGRLRPLR